MFCTPLLVAVLSLAAGPAVAQSQVGVQKALANIMTTDTNGDGVISRDEFHDVLAARWKHIDRNADGYLDEDDFPAGAAMRARTQLAQISDLDANGDGRISKGEVLNRLSSGFAQADANADGVLSPAEIEAAAF